MIASLGAILGSVGPGLGKADAFPGGLVVWLIAVFVAVVAPEGAVLIERVVESVLEREGDPDRSPE